MRILHCVTLVSPTGEFGGPTTVAVGQCRELLRRGHGVELIAGARGHERRPDQVDGVPALLREVRTVLPGAGFSGLVSARLLARAWREVGRADVVHVHLARDLITLPVALIAVLRKRRLVVQPHGMVDASPRRSAALLDRLATRRVVTAAEAVLNLSAAELADLREVFGDGPRYVELPNGVAEIRDTPRRRDTAAPVDVVFVARLAERKRPLLFVEAARKACRDGLDARFTLYGPDEGMGSAVRRALAADDAGGRIRWEGPLAPEAVSERVATADVLMNTTDYDPFPMSVLEALAAGTPVLMGRRSPMAEVLDRAGAGTACEETAVGFATALGELVGEEAGLARASELALELARRRYGLDAVVERLEDVYRGVVR